MNIKVIFWDVDGVIVDSELLHKAKVRVTAKSHGIEVTQDMWSGWHGLGDHRIYDVLSEMGLEISKKDFLQQCEDYYSQRAKSLKIRDGFKEAFQLAADKGIVQAAVSSGVKRQVDTNLRVARVDKEMLFAVNADDMTSHGLKTKPAPDPYIFALEKLNEIRTQDSLPPIEPGECLVIEDSSSGVESGKAADMMTLHWRLTQEAPISDRADLKAYDRPTFEVAIRQVL